MPTPHRPALRQRDSDSSSNFRLAKPVLRLAVLGALCLGSATLVAVPATAHAQAAQSFNIPSGPLGAALSEFAAAAGVTLSSDAAQTRGLQSPGLVGQYSVAAGFSKLLAGSGLEAVQQGNGSYTLRKTAAGSTLLPEVKVTASTAYPDALSLTYAGGQVARGGRLGMLGNADIMDAPFNITAYTATLIEDQQAKSLLDVLANDPSTRSTSFSYYDNFNIRGFSVSRFGSTAFEGLYGIASIEGILLEGLERVELLKGPSTFVNGMSPSGSIGGALNLVPKRAGKDPITRFTVGFQSDNIWSEHLDVGRRFGGNDELGVRVNLAHSDGDSAIEGESRKSSFGSVGLDYTTDRARITVDAGQSERITHGYGSFFLINGGFAVPTPPSAKRSYGQPWSDIKQDHRFGVIRGEFNVSDDLTVGAAFGTAQANQIGLRNGNPRIINNAGDVTVNPSAQAFHDKWDSTSKEASLRYKLKTGAVGHTLSVAATDVRRQYSGASAQIGSTYGFNIYGALPVNLQPALPLGGLVTSPEDKWRSVAFSDVLSFLDDHLLLTLGFREQRVQSGGVYDRKETTPAAGVVFKPTASWSVYANYVEALQIGPTAPTDASNAGQVFAPYIGKQKEAGVKYDGGTYGASASLFQIVQPSAFKNLATNVYGVFGEQRNRGLELQLYGEIVKGVRLLGGTSYTQAELTKTQGGAMDGNTAPNVPKWLANLSAEWDVAAIPHLTLTGRAIYTGSQYIDATNRQPIPAWTRFDIGARYTAKIAGKKVVFRANIDNLTDRNYWMAAMVLSQPRTLSMSSSIDF